MVDLSQNTTAMAVGLKCNELPYVFQHLLKSNKQRHMHTCCQSCLGRGLFDLSLSCLMHVDYLDAGKRGSRKD